MWSRGVAKRSGWRARCAVCAGYVALLVEQGYVPSAVEGQLRLMAHLSRWLAEQRAEPVVLTPEVVEQFLGSRPAGRRAFGPLLSRLRDLGVVPQPTSVDTPVEWLLAEYREYLVRERGLVAGSLELRERVARLFLVERPEPLELALQRLQASDVTAFVLAKCRSGRLGKLVGENADKRVALAASLPAFGGMGGLLGWRRRCRVLPAGGWPRCRVHWRQSRFSGCC
jgi:integrase/recombinase XerD